MGGFGSGCYARVGGAPKVEDYRCIDLADLRRWRMLRPGGLRVIVFGREKPEHLWVRTRADGAGLLLIKRSPAGALGKLFVPFAYTPTACGGRRRWFLCPGCRRRCRCLYGRDTLACRQCRGAKYASQSEKSQWRALRRADSLRRRLDPRSTAYGIDPQFPPKPPRMRWRTYAELQRKDEALRSRFLAGAAATATYAVQDRSRRLPQGRRVKV